MARHTVLGKLCNRTYIHGIPDLYNSNKIFLKSIWTIILLGALAGIIYSTYQMIISYLQYQTVTQVSQVRVSKMPFPNITVCHGGLMNKTYIEQNIQLPPDPIPVGYDSNTIKTEFVKYFFALAYQSIRVDPNAAGYLQKTYDHNFNAGINSNDVLSFMNKSAYQCDQVLQQCAFMLKVFPCCDIVEPVLSDYGICHHMQLKNRDPSETGQAMQLIAGSLPGFMLVVKQKKSEILTVGDESNMGVRVHFTSFLEPNDYGSVRLLPQLNGVIRLKPIRNIFDPNAHSCLTKPKYLAYQQAYTKGLCQNECARNFSMQICGCTPAGYSTKISSPLVCSPQKMLDCLLPKLSRAEVDRNSSLYQCYNDYCLDFCDTWDYGPTIAYSGLLPADADGRSLSESDQSAESSDTFFTALTVYFGEMQYRQIQEQPLQTLEVFICNLGGTWGLWSGVSAVAFVQFFYILFCGYWEGDSGQSEWAEKAKMANRPAYQQSVANQQPPVVVAPTPNPI